MIGVNHVQISNGMNSYYVLPACWEINVQPEIQELQQTSIILKFMHGNESVSKNISCHVFKEGCLHSSFGDTNFQTSNTNQSWQYSSRVHDFKLSICSSKRCAYLKLGWFFSNTRKKEGSCVDFETVRMRLNDVNIRLRSDKGGLTATYKRALF